MEKILKGLQKIFVLYLLSFFLFNAIVDKNKIHLRILNNLLSTIDYLVEFSSGEEPFDRETFLGYVDYYKQILKYMPRRADALGLLGYCYYYLGEKSRAIDFFQEAIDQEPGFFWFHYNLGLIYFQDGLYEKAQDSFKRALSCDPEKTLKFVYSSRILQYIGPTDKVDFPVNNGYHKRSRQEIYQELGTGLEKAYQRARQLLILSFNETQNFSEMLQAAQIGLENHKGDPLFFYFYAGLGAYQLKNYPVALGFFNHCIEKDPRSQAFHYLGLTLLAMHQDQLARPILQSYENHKEMYAQKENLSPKELLLRVF